MLFVHAQRSVLIRTRMDADLVRARLAELAASLAPDGLEGITSQGYFRSGGVGQKDFHFEYYFNSPKNPHTFDVKGRIVEEPDWRVLRVNVRAQNPWLEKWILAGIAFFGALQVVLNDLPLGTLLFVGLFMVLVSLVANFLYIPDVVARRVAALLARDVRGSVRIGNQWVVPERE